MPPLRRNGPRLLRTVGGKPHATRDDHESDNLTEDDIFADPKGSSDVESQAHDSGVSITIGSQTDGLKSSADMDTTFSASVPDKDEGMFGEHTRKTKRKYTANIHAGLQDRSKKHRTISYSAKDRFRAEARVQEASVEFKRPQLSSTVDDSSQSGQKSAPTFRKPTTTVAPRAALEEPPPNVPSFKAPSAFGRVSTRKTPPPKFQLPSLAKHPETADEELSPLSDAPSWIADDDGEPVPSSDGLVHLFEAQCPICGDSVDKDALDDFQLDHPRMDLHAQQLFCRTHKNHDALGAWYERGYPDIDWDKFPLRLKKFSPAIADLLKMPDSSYFRSKMEQRNLRGKDRTLMMMHWQKEDVENCTVGYYGPKGLNLMTHFILNQFADEIRKLAGSDTVIAARGPTGYVQMVLAPELATLLVKEDMREVKGDMTDERAREILSESIDLGELLNGIEDWTQHLDVPESQRVVVEGGLEDI